MTLATPPARFVIQIAFAGTVLYALCNDFTMWTLSGTTWTQVTAVPLP